MGRRSLRTTTAVAAAALAAIGATGCEEAPAPRLVVSPESGMAGDPVEVTVSGATPGEAIRIDLTSVTADGSTWRSNANFRVPSSGTLTLADPAIDGTYVGSHSTGLASTLMPDKAAPSQPKAVRQGPTWTFTAQGPSGVIGSARTQRLNPVDTGVTLDRIDLAIDGFVGTLAMPTDTTDSAPAAVVLGGNEGGIAGAETMAQFLAARGIPTLAVGYWGMPGLPEASSRIPLEYVVRAIEYLKEVRGVDRDRIVVAGVSAGTEAALLLAAYEPDLVAGVVSIAGSSNVHSGYAPDARGGRLSGRSQWTWRGKDVPFSPLRIAPPPEDPSNLPVERLTADILLVCGERDVLTRACDAADAISARIDAAGGAAPEALRYPEAGHFLSGVPWTSAVEYGLSDPRTVNRGGGTAVTDGAAAADAWPKIVAFIKNIPAN